MHAHVLDNITIHGPQATIAVRAESRDYSLMDLTEQHGAVRSAVGSVNAALARQTCCVALSPNRRQGITSRALHLKPRHGTTGHIWMLKSVSCCPPSFGWCVQQSRWLCRVVPAWNVHSGGKRVSPNEHIKYVKLCANVIDISTMCHA